jgi:hypothetical protein
MFVYDERTAVNAGYMTYMILPLGNAREINISLVE